MRISYNEEGTITVNGLTFIQFMNAFQGFYILDKRNNQVPKYLLYWAGIHPEKVKEKYNLEYRK